MKRIIDLKKENIEHLFNLIKDDKDSWFNPYCSTCKKNRKDGGWCFPTDDSNYNDCDYLKDYFKNIYKVDIEDIRFIEIEDNDISTIKCYKEI